jgi:hypothetical protein
MPPAITGEAGVVSEEGRRQEDEDYGDSDIDKDDEDGLLEHEDDDEQRMEREEAESAVQVDEGQAGECAADGNAAAPIDVDVKDGEGKSVDNPGKWSAATFKYKATKGYAELPGGARVLEANGDGKRIVGDPQEDREYEFHYGGDVEGFGDGAFGSTSSTGKDMFSEEQGPKLDVPNLLKMGMTRARAIDPLFLMFIVYPLLACMTAAHPVGCQCLLEPTGRVAFFSQIVHWSNKYALEIGLGGGTGHLYTLRTLVDIVRWFGIILYSGQIGGHRALYRYWDVNDKHL